MKRTVVGVLAEEALFGGGPGVRVWVGCRLAGTGPWTARPPVLLLERDAERVGLVGEGGVGAAEAFGDVAARQRAGVRKSERGDISVNPQSMRDSAEQSGREPPANEQRAVAAAPSKSGSSGNRVGASEGGSAV